MEFFFIELTPFELQAVLPQVSPGSTRNLAELLPETR